MRNIASVDVVEISAGLTVLAVVGSLLVAFIGIVVIAALTKKSCPFLYSFDGQQYVFDGEPYGGAIMSSLARIDYPELKHPPRGQAAMASCAKVQRITLACGPATCPGAAPSSLITNRTAAPGLHRPAAGFGERGG